MCLVIGADAFREIRTWKAFPEMLDRCHFAVVSRPGSPAHDLRTTLPEWSGRMIDCAGMSRFDTRLDPSIILIDAPTAPISSTDVRRRLAASASIAGLVPDPVARYISKHGLYAEQV